MLVLSEVHTYYGRVHALKGISLKVDEGEIVALIGPNGAGKTTTIKTILGLCRSERGDVIFKQMSIRNLPPERIVRFGIAYVPEGRRIFPLLTVTENLEVGGYSCNEKSTIVKKKIGEIFELFPQLASRGNQLGGSLSGGEQQMLAIGRALMASPQILLLDEPSLGLAPLLVGHVFEKIIDLNAKGMTILLIEQNAHIALNVSNRAYVVENGSVVLTDDSSSLLLNEQVKKSYLGVT
jgi:branched-chain amino acid transport system ATP-binding protein